VYKKCYGLGISFKRHVVMIMYTPVKASKEKHDLDSLPLSPIFTFDVQ